MTPKAPNRPPVAADINTPGKKASTKVAPEADKLIQLPQKPTDNKAKKAPAPSLAPAGPKKAPAPIAKQAAPAANKKLTPSYQRFIFNNDNGDGDCIENEQVLVDAVEMNALMPVKSEL